MKQQRLVPALVCGLAMLGLTAGAQVQAPPQPMVSMAPPLAVAGGTVTGHVYCNDTQRPARFADVDLLQATDTNARGRGGNRGMQYQSVGRGRTALDGSFMITNVPAGDYYVAATMTGYISPQAVARMTQAPIAGAPMTHVDVNRSADVVVSMERGAVVSGRVTYDEGSPVAGVSVRLRPADSSGATGGAVFGSGFPVAMMFMGEVGAGITDDRGVFRIVGVPPGKYIVATTVQTESIGQGRAGRQTFRGPAPFLNVYAPSTMHKADAQTVEIRGGETVDGIDVRVALIGLHTVKGKVESKADGHMLSGGYVSLTDSNDSSSMRTAMVEQDGTFRMDYLPAGSYTVSVSGEDRPTEGGGRPGNVRGGKRYERGTMNFTVGDHDVVLDAVQLDEAKSSTSASN